MPKWSTWTSERRRIFFSRVLMEINKWEKEQLRQKRIKTTTKLLKEEINVRIYYMHTMEANVNRNDCVHGAIVHIIQWQMEWNGIEQVVSIRCVFESCAQKLNKRDVINTVSMTIFFHFFFFFSCLWNLTHICCCVPWSRPLLHHKRTNEWTIEFVDMYTYLFIYLCFLLTTSHSRTQIIMYVGEIFRSFDKMRSLVRPHTTN